MSAWLDAGLPDAVADQASAVEPPTDGMSPGDLLTAAADAADASTDPKPSDAASTLDLPADHHGRDDVPLEAPPSQDASVDVPRTADLPAASNDLAEERFDGGGTDACQAVANSTFLSTENHECGPSYRDDPLYARIARAVDALLEHSNVVAPSTYSSRWSS